MTTKFYNKALGRKANYFYDGSDIWKYGLNTKGLNNICTWQSIYFKNNPKPPFFKCGVDIEKFIPKKIMEKLDESKNFIKKHKIGFIG